MCAVGNAFIYMHLAKWVALALGLKLNSQMKAMIGQSRQHTRTVSDSPSFGGVDPDVNRYDPEPFSIVVFHESADSHGHERIP